MEDGRVWVLWALVVLFGASSWAGVNAFWLELPLIAPAAPEGWDLPSWLAVLVQLGNVGPLLFGVLKSARPGLAHRLTPALIGGAKLSGLVALLLLAFLWRTRGRVGGAEHSVALLPLAWAISLINCASNVLCLPWMGRFRSATPLTLYFLGMSLSGFLPALAALAQGAGAVVCRNSTNGTTPEFTPPHFPPRTFFLLVAVLIAAALTAFIVLWRWDFARSKRSDAFAEASEGQVKPPQAVSVSALEVGVLLGVTGWICALMDTVLPSVQSYAATPYGGSTYHYVVVGTGLAAPLGSLLAFRWRPRRLGVFALLTAVLSLSSGFLVLQAAQSPSPPLAGTAAGSWVSVAVWSASFLGFAFVRATAAERLRGGGGERLLFWCGVATQVGSFAGAAVVFPLVNVYRVFVSPPLCP